MPGNNFRYAFFIRIAIESEGFLCHSRPCGLARKGTESGPGSRAANGFERFIRMEIRILEADEHPHYELKISDEHIHKTFVRDASPVFHRTKYLNRLMQEAEGAIVGIWDTDVLLPKEQILEAVDAIRKRECGHEFSIRRKILYASAGRQYAAEETGNEHGGMLSEDI